ncbi:hypothetical protein [Bradyrhizobium jicamae]|nr:hypothetical protein [Bradyrhizobium jicamae]
MARQRSVIAKENNLGLDVAGADQLLVQFEKSQAIFDADLERLLRERDSR